MQKIAFTSDVGGLQLHHWAMMRYFELRNIKVELEDLHGKERRLGSNTIEDYDAWLKDNPYGTILYRIHPDNTGTYDNPEYNNGYFDDMLHLDRSDLLLHQVLEEGTEDLPSTKNGYKYVEIPDDVKWHIWQEDGPMVEHVCENARQWD